MGVCFFSRFYKKATALVNCKKTAPLNYLYLNYAWDINQLNYSLELGLLISYALHFQVFNTANNLKATRATPSS